MPVVLDQELMEQGSVLNYPSKIPLMNSKEKLKCRKVRSVLRFPPQNKNLHPEKYAHHLLMCYYPFRSEEELKLGTYTEKLLQPGVLEIVNENKMLVEPFGELVDQALQNLVIDSSQHNLDPFAQQENEEVEENMDIAGVSDDEEQEVHSDSSYSVIAQRMVVSDDELFHDIRSLNFMQRHYFDKIYDWAKNLVKLRNCELRKNLAPLYIFLTGEGGCGKSHLLKVIHKSLTKILMHRGGKPDKQKVLRIAPTGVAAINIGGTTIHTGLGIHDNGLCGPLNDKRMASLRNQLSDVEVIMIDEIIIVSGML